MLSSILLTVLSLAALPPIHGAPSVAREPVSLPREMSHAPGEYVKVRRRVGAHGNARRKHKNTTRSARERACSEPGQGAFNPDSTPITPASAFFPITPRNSWSTANGEANHFDSKPCPSHIAHTVNSALKPLTAGRLPPLGTAPDNSPALVASYPAGTVKYSAATGHGYSFYTAGAHAGVDTTTATEVVFSYSVFFSDGFDFVRGGKLPGLYGGVSLDEAKSCSGGRQGERDDCFSARLMWRADGAGEIYNYLPTSGHQSGGYCSTAPKSVCDANFGDSSESRE
jgi:hypothetical protein